MAAANRKNSPAAGMDGVMERLITLLNTPVSGEWKFWIDVIVMVIVVAVIWVLPKGE